MYHISFTAFTMAKVNGLHNTRGYFFLTMHMCRHDCMQCMVHTCMQVCMVVCMNGCIAG